MHAIAVRSAVVLVAVAALVGASAGPAAALSPTWTLTVNTSGPGTVTGPGINCGIDCTQSYSNNCAYDPDLGQAICEPTSATVTASPQTGYSVAWSGCDQVSGSDCTVESGTSTAVTATFSDTQAPTASLTAPSAGIKSGTISLAATASDGAGVKQVDFYVRGALYASDTTAPYGVSLNTTSVSDGSAAIAARAVDNSNNVSGTSGTTITIDNNAPSVGDISGPGAGPFGPVTTQSFSWTVSDSPGSGISSVQCKLDDGAFGACGSNTTASYSDLPDGSHTLTVKATDNAGHTTTKAYAWSIDAVAPVAQFTSGPADGSSSAETSAAFTFIADEPSTFQCRFYEASVTAPAFSACMSPDSFSVSGLAPGTYVLEVMPTDGVGNAGTAIKRTFVVTVPTSTSTGGGSGSPSGSDTGTPPLSEGSPSAGKAAIAATLAAKWSVKAGKTRPKSFKLAKLPAAAAIKVACKARKKGCPFKSKSFKPKAGGVDLTKTFRKPLAAGTKITITITAPGMSGQQITLTMQKTKAPKKTSKQLS